MTERICSTTGLHLVAADGQTAYRGAKDRYGALSARPNEHVGPRSVGFDPGVGDSSGRYLAEASPITFPQAPTT